MQVWRNTRKDKCYLLNSCFVFLSGGHNWREKHWNFPLETKFLVPASHHPQNCLHEKTVFTAMIAEEGNCLMAKCGGAETTVSSLWRWQTCQKGEMEMGSHIRKPLGSLSGTSMALVRGTQAWVGFSNLPLISATVEAFLYHTFAAELSTSLKRPGFLNCRRDG